jgi:hypothetical protein
MNLAHLHLLLNHLPTIGTVVAIGLFIVSLGKIHHDVRRVSLGLFFVIAVFSMPAYMTGNAAQEAILGQEGVSEAMMARHQEAALLAFLLMEITGLVAWFALWQFRRTAVAASWVVPAMLIFSIVTFVLMARAATMGGEIRHPEIRAEVAATEAQGGLFSGASIQTFIGNQPWAWPAAETLHFIGLCLLFGAAFVINLRLLGVLKNMSFAALHRLLPVGILGFAINTLTGMLFFVGTPEQYTQNGAFYWKVAFMMIASLSVLYLTLFDEPWNVGSGDDAPVTAKIVAASTIFLWLGVLYCGRMLPYLGNSF